MSEAAAEQWKSKARESRRSWGFSLRDEEDVQMYSYDVCARISYSLLFLHYLIIWPETTNIYNTDII